MSRIALLVLARPGLSLASCKVGAPPNLESFVILTLQLPGLSALGLDTSAGTLEPLAGIAVSHISHLLSVLVLYQLGLTLSKNKRLSFTAALLHIVSPAGLFLSAPYAESTFTFLSFLGYLFLAKGLLTGPDHEERRFAHDAALISSGLWFAFSCFFRSNGLFSGVPFAFALAAELTSYPNLASIRRRLALVVGGSAIAVGFLAPQLSAYLSFCVRQGDEALRPWCDKGLPSIYTFVQAHYWYVLSSIFESKFRKLTTCDQERWLPPLLGAWQHPFVPTCRSCPVSHDLFWCRYSAVTHVASGRPGIRDCR